jgi:hypothetical protein
MLSTLFPRALVAAQYWPIVKRVRIRSRKWRALSSGTILVDAPGVRDDNSARDQVPTSSTSTNPSPRPNPIPAPAAINQPVFHGFSSVTSKKSLSAMPHLTTGRSSASPSSDLHRPAPALPPLPSGSQVVRQYLQEADAVWIVASIKVSTPPPSPPSP